MDGRELAELVQRAHDQSPRIANGARAKLYRGGKKRVVALYALFVAAASVTWVIAR